MPRAIIALLGLVLGSALAQGCGLDWTLPQAHFDGVEEHGYVAYWEKIGEVSIGEKLAVPVNIGFSSRRESSSPVLGKGWIVALLESHVEPLDENNMRVIMPDGWTFTFVRNGNTNTWRGNAGWAGETDGSVFTIAALCGWKIKFDGGKILEIDGNQGEPLTYRYNGGVPTEIDQGGKALVQVEMDPNSRTATALVIGDQKINITQAQRPRIINAQKLNLVSGFDSCLSSLVWPDGKMEDFTFGTDKALNPTLTISGTGRDARAITWDAATRQIQRDGVWLYTLQQVEGHMRFNRTRAGNQTESYEADDAIGMTAEKLPGADGIVTYRFTSGTLAGRVRKIEDIPAAGARKLLYSASYFPSGELLRETFYPDKVRIYSEQRMLLKETIAGQVDYEQDLDVQGRVVHVLDTVRQYEVKRTYDAAGGQTANVFLNGALFCTEKIDDKNQLISINEGGK